MLHGCVLSSPTAMHLCTRDVVPTLRSAYTKADACGLLRSYERIILSFPHQKNNILTTTTRMFVPSRLIEMHNMEYSSRWKSRQRHRFILIRVARCTILSVPPLLPPPYPLCPICCVRTGMEPNSTLPWGRVPLRSRICLSSDRYSHLHTSPRAYSNMCLSSPHSTVSLQKILGFKIKLGSLLVTDCLRSSKFRYKCVCATATPTCSIRFSPFSLFFKTLRTAKKKTKQQQFKRRRRTHRHLFLVSLTIPSRCLVEAGVY